MNLGWDFPLVRYHASCDHSAHAPDTCQALLELGGRTVIQTSVRRNHWGWHRANTGCIFNVFFGRSRGRTPTEATLYALSKEVDLTRFLR